MKWVLTNVGNVLKVRWSRESVAGRGPSGFPVMGEQVLNLVDGMRGKALEDVAEVGERVDTVDLTGGDQAGVRRTKRYARIGKEMRGGVIIILT